MLAEDFIRLVPFNAFRTGIPTDHVSARVEHQQRVVRNRVNQQTEAFLAGLQGIISTFAAALRSVKEFFDWNTRGINRRSRIAVTTAEAADMRLALPRANARDAKAGVSSSSLSHTTE